jgi:hypothetical protein
MRTLQSTDCIRDRQLTVLLARQEVANLQARYLYYTQAHDYDRVLDLFDFADEAVSVEISSTGVYVGEEKIRAFFLELIKPLFTAAGSLPIHMLNTPCIEIAPDGCHATGMWQTLGCNAFPTSKGLQATWQQGKYDNTFTLRDGVWRFQRFRWLCNFRTPFDVGWVDCPMTKVEPLDLSHFPERCHPSLPSEPYPGYDPAHTTNFGPLPPEPVA